MEKLCADDASTKAALMWDEIGELRKYIVKIMHAEMELMENIKLNERNVAAVNAHIKHFKELIAQERSRNKTLKEELAGDTNELKRLEEKQTVAEAKHRQFRDAVLQRESEVQVLRSRFQQQHAAMLSLRRHVLEVTTHLEKLSSLNGSVDNETQNAHASLNECSEPIEQRAARQKLRAKIRYTEQFIAQMQEEAQQLIEERTKLEVEVLGCEQEAHKLRGSIYLNEKESEVVFQRLHEDTLRVIEENGKIESKLKAKRRKFRLKTKNEICSLNRRTVFITSELERGQMMNEDALSAIDFLGVKRKELEQRLNTRNEQLIATESAVSGLSKTISGLRRGEGKIDTTRLAEELATKRGSAQAAQKKLDEKQNLLKLLEADHTQLNATLEDICTKIVAAKDTTEGLDREIASLAKDIEKQDERSKILRASLTDSKKSNENVQAEHGEHQRENKSIVEAQAKLRRQRDSLLKEEEEMTSELHEAEALSQILAEGINHGTKYAKDICEASALDEDMQTRIEFELRSQELSLQQQCAQEESKFQARIADWDEKIKNVERQLRSL
ncbi:hypothetical protein PRNP1_003727 [Phytophthora ramorum]